MAHGLKRLAAILLFGLVGTVAVMAHTQDLQLPELPGLSGSGILDQLGGGGIPDTDQVKFSGEYRVDAQRGIGQLTIQAEIIEGWHIYSTTQKAGGPLPSQFVVKSAGAELTRPLVADRAPKVVPPEVFPVPSEEFEGRVTWTAPFKVPPGSDPEKLAFEIKYNGLTCSVAGQCLPINQQPVPIKYAGEYSAPALGEYQPKQVHVRLSGNVAPRTVKPGSSVQVSVTFEPTGGYHLYPLPEEFTSKISKPTLIAWKSRPEWEMSKPATKQKMVEHVTGLPEEPIQYYYEEPVTWTTEFQVPADATPGGYLLEGVLGFQTCFADGCDMPSGANFRAVVEVSKQAEDRQPEPLAFVADSYGSASKLAGSSPKSVASVEPPGRGGVEPAGLEATSGAASLEPSRGSEPAEFNLSQLKPVGEGADQNQSILVVMPMAFVAGFLLNFMPCVLPVIGLKLVSFVHQAGEHRSRVFALNLWYTLGLLSVFMVLATLAVVFGFSWGDQFRSAAFNIVLACVVFAFALSFLGVWEIPLPGFVGSGGVNKAAEKEGPLGAFFKGVLTTILATPCGGPLLVPALTWAIRQPPAVTYLGFACVGLGMALPYLVVGAFPRLIKALPKPGEWMETFKEVMGFVLMGTVVLILSYIPIRYVVPTVAMMMGLWMALWWVGRVPVWEELHKRLRAWAGATAFAAVVGLLSYMWLDDVMEHRFQREVDVALSERFSSKPGAEVARTATTKGDSELPWQPYSHELLARNLAEKKTVLVDFTADWCLTCKINEQVALNVAATKQFVEANHIVTLKADKTGTAPEVDELLTRLGGGAIPYIAIFPATAPDQPIVYGGPLTSNYVLELLKKALASSGGMAAADARATTRR